MVSGLAEEGRATGAQHTDIEFYNDVSTPQSQSLTQRSETDSTEGSSEPR